MKADSSVILSISNIEYLRFTLCRSTSINTPSYTQSYSCLFIAFCCSRSWNGLHYQLHWSAYRCFVAIRHFRGYTAMRNTKTKQKTQLHFVPYDASWAWGYLGYNAIMLLWNGLKMYMHFIEVYSVIYNWTLW